MSAVFEKEEGAMRRMEAFKKLLEYRERKKAQEESQLLRKETSQL